MKKGTILTIAIAVIAMIAMNMTLNAQSGKLSDMTLSEMVAQAGDEGDDQSAEGSAEACQKCGNCLYIPDSQLELTGCWLGLGGQHFKCKSSTTSCCDPSEQTPCGGIKG